jgi:hypothetical protein
MFRLQELPLSPSKSSKVYLALRRSGKLACIYDAFTGAKRYGSRGIRALLFTRSGMFINSARADPGLFYSDHGRLKLSSPNTVAVGVMTGVISECAIVAEGSIGAPESLRTVHKVTVAPFHQEIRRDTTLWGTVLGFYSISSAISLEGLAFTTRTKPTYFDTSHSSSLVLHASADVNLAYRRWFSPLFTPKRDVSLYFYSPKSCPCQASGQLCYLSFL